MIDAEAFTPGPGGRLRAAGGSDIGQERTENEDAWLCEPDRGLFVVADGMGGHAAGEQASAAVIRTLNVELEGERLHAVTAEGEEAVRALLDAALNAANAAVLSLSQQHPEWDGLGTTAVIAVIDGDRLYVANVGDSRAYLLNGGRAEQLTRDHSVAATLVDNGMIAQADLRAHPMRNQLTMVLGSSEQPQPAFAARPLRPGDRIALCSDGLWDMLDDTDIAQIVRFSATPREAVYSLIAEADTAGGLDNITAVVIFQ